ncbi:MAG: nitronate monooxygenase [Capsulimonadaceae bacterium]
MTNTAAERGYWGGRPFSAPRLIQAGMGVRISGAKLANVTARLGAVGVVSSVGLRHIVGEEVRRGDPEAIAIAQTFPLPRYVEDLMAFAPGGRMHKTPLPMDCPNPAKAELPRRLSAICAYIEVMRAKQGHRGMVGINVMWKCALTVLPSLYGAMLAGVDALLCGAGVPMDLPDIVARMEHGEDMDYVPLHGTETSARLKISDDQSMDLITRHRRPMLIPILSNYAFPKRIVDIWERQYGLAPDAFVLENHRAGGHNAPPRNRKEFGEADELTGYFYKVRDLGIPVYVAGSGSTHEEMEAWINEGAYGLQVGSRFALCTDSGMSPDLREQVVDYNRELMTDVRTANRLSSTGYPFKYVPLAGTLSDRDVYEKRKRICDHGYLQHSLFTPQEDGTVKETYICPAMPEAQFAKLGGKVEDTPGIMCLCNALLATAGLAKPGEPPLVTLGESGKNITEILTARQVMEDILSPEYVAAMEERLVEPTAVSPLRPVCLATK